MPRLPLAGRPTAPTRPPAAGAGVGVGVVAATARRRDGAVAPLADNNSDNDSNNDSTNNKKFRAAKSPSRGAEATRSRLRTPGGGFIAGLLNGLSDGAFGGAPDRSGGGGGGGGGAFSPASLYRALLRLGPSVPVPRTTPAAAPDDSDVPAEQAEALAALLLVSRRRAAALVRRCPRVRAMPPRELGGRVLALKAALPGCDVAALVEARPDLYLGAEDDTAAAAADDDTVAADGDEGEGGQGRRGAAAAAAAAAAPATAKEREARHPGAATAARAAAALDALRRGLPGADVEAMAFEDAALLLHPPARLARGLRRLRALWPEADGDTFAASEPHHLALAGRALGEGEGDDDDGGGEGGGGGGV